LLAPINQVVHLLANEELEQARLQILIFRFALQIPNEALPRSLAIPNEWVLL
jgi:hypothetical protein